MAWFHNLKTKSKLMLAFAIVAGIAGVVGYVGISDLAEMDRMIDRMYARDLKGVQHVQVADMRMVETQRTLAQSTCVSCHDPHGAKLGNGSEIEVAEREAHETEQESIENLRALGATLEDDAQKAQAAEALKLLTEHSTATKSLFAALRAGDRTGAIAAYRQTRALSDRFNEPVEKVADDKVKVAEATYRESDADVGRARFVLTGLVLGCVGLAFVIGFILARTISQPLDKAVDVLKSVAAGDLTRTLDLSSRDEIGQMAAALTTAVASMRSTLIEVQTTAGSVASAAQQLSASAEQISSGAQEQASSLEETAASLEQMTSTVRQNADNAQQANQLALAAREIADNGGAASGQAVAAMGDINQASKRIADIITTIDEIAFQTNLLALNAAVEAARAGEQGRGFAVVAAEVRSLAQRSASAAKEIKGLIQDSVRKVDNGSDLVNASGRTLHEIVGSVKRVTDIVGEIAAASREQSAGIEQVNKAVTQMDQVTQANASQTEELSGTAEALAAQAQELQSLVGRFSLGVAVAAPKAAPSAARLAAKVPPKLRVATGTRPPVVDGTAALDAEFEEF